MAARNSLRDSDWSMLLAALMITAIGILQIYSATHQTASWQGAWWRQALYVGTGIVLLWVLSHADYHTLLSHAPIYYGVAVVLLLVVLLVGQTVSGGQRW